MQNQNRQQETRKVVNDSRENANATQTHAPRPPRKSRESRRTKPVENPVENKTTNVVTPTEQQTPKTNVKESNKNVITTGKNQQTKTESTVEKTTVASTQTTIKSAPAKPLSKEENVATVENPSTIDKKSSQQQNTDASRKVTEQNSNRATVTNEDHKTAADTRRKRKVPSHLGGNRYKRTTVKAPMTDQIIPTPIERPKPKTIQSAIRTAIVDTRITNYNEEIKKVHNPEMNEHAKEQPFVDKSGDKTATAKVKTSADMPKTVEKNKTTKQPKKTTKTKDASSTETSQSKPAKAKKSSKTDSLSTTEATPSSKENKISTAKKTSSNAQQSKPANSAAGKASSGASKPNFQPKKIEAAYKTQPKKTATNTKDEAKIQQKPTTQSSFSPPTKPGS